MTRFHRFYRWRSLRFVGVSPDHGPIRIGLCQKRMRRCVFVFVFGAGTEMQMLIFTAAKSLSFPFSLNPDCTGNAFRGRAISAAFGLPFFSMTDAEARDCICFWCWNRNENADYHSY